MYEFAMSMLLMTTGFALAVAGIYMILLACWALCTAFEGEK